MKPRRHISHVSATRAKQKREYASLKADFLASNPRCFSCGERIANEHRELHHYYGRVGRLLTWQPGFRMACHLCHDSIHRFPKWAREYDRVCPRGMWNDFKRAQAHHLSSIAEPLRRMDASLSPPDSQ